VKNRLGSGGEVRLLIISARRAPFEIGARLLAALTFPGIDEAARRRAAAIAWCTDYVSKCIQMEPERADKIRSAYPQYFRMTTKEIKAALRTSYSRLERRILAGKMARGIFQEHLDRRPPVLAPGMRRHSLNELSKLVLKEAHQSDPHNVETRIWGTSKPVIHLASGYDLLARLLSPDRESQYQMNDLELHRFLIGYGEWAEPIVLGAKQFRIGPEQLLRVRLR